VTIFCVPVKMSNIDTSCNREGSVNSVWNEIRYKFLILATYRPDILNVREQGCKDPWLCWEPKGICQQRSLGSTGLDVWLVSVMRVSLPSSRDELSLDV